MNQAFDAGELENQIQSLRRQLEDAEELRYAISRGEVDAFVVGPTEDSKRVLMLSGAYVRYRQLVEEMQQGALTVSRGGEIMFANHAFAALLNMMPADLFRAPLTRYVSAADRPAVASLLDSRSGSRSGLKATLRGGDGAERRVRISLVSANDDFVTLLVTERSAEDEEAGETVDAIRTGQIDALVVGGERIVMLDSAQRFYQAAVDRMQQGVLIVGAEDVIAYANQRMAALTGMRRETLSGMSLHRLVHNADQDKLRSVLNTREGASTQAEVRLRRADNEYVNALVTVSAVADGQKMCLVSDLSRQKRHEAADERSRQFLGTLAHEFRNILAPIRTAVEFLKRQDNLDEDCRKMVEVLDRQSSRLVGLVEDLRRVNPKD